MGNLTNTTIIIKTFERPDALRRLLESIRKYYPDTPILIADGSEEPQPVKGHNIKWYALPFDTGLAAGRNYLIKRVATKYTVVLDDDFLFTDETRLELLKEAIEDTGLDLVSADVIQDGKPVKYHGLLEVKDNMLHYVKGDKGNRGPVILLDLMLNFFMAKTTMLRQNPWTDKLKVAEHTDWFLRTKHIPKGYLPGVSVLNTKAPYNQQFGDFRRRSLRYTYTWLTDHGLQGVVNFNGKKFINVAHEAYEDTDDIKLAATRKTLKRMNRI